MIRTYPVEPPSRSSLVERTSLKETQTFLSFMCESGSGVPQDSTEAVKWLRQAAEQGQGPAQMALGNMYRFGDGVSEEFIEAAKWHRKASDQGNGHAQAALEMMYEAGQITTMHPA